MSEVSVVGSGLAGTLLALHLAQAGHKARLYERRQDPRLVAQPAGRSINLALSARGLHALAEVGLREKVLERALPMRGRMMHAPDGKLSFAPYGQTHEHINSISRAWLNEVLMDAAEAAGVPIHFAQRCTGYDFDTRSAWFADDAAGGKAYSLSCSPLLGTDGAGSALRRALVQRVRVNYAQDYLAHGYKELTIAPGPDGDFAMEPGALHIWPRRSFMLIALPNPDKTFTCTLFLAFEADDSMPGFDQLNDTSAVQAFFEAHFPDVIPLIADLPGEFMRNPTGALATIHTAPWYAEGDLLLLGDAAHAIVPFFGQGMNAAFEDVTVLMKLLGQSEGQPDWQDLFKRFYQNRKPDADAIAAMALENFIEMRDRVADPIFLLQKQVSLRLEQQYPDLFIPKYSLVSFHRVPYSDALRHGELQAGVLNRLCEGLSGPEDLEAVDWSKAEALMQAFRAAAPPLSEP